MADEPIDYAAVLAAMETQRAKLDTAIAAIRELLSPSGPDIGSAPLGSSIRPPEDKKTELPTKIQSDTFFSLSMPEAIKKYLAMTKRPQSPADIAKALEQGGLTSIASDLRANVTSTLTRMKRDTNEVVPVRRGEWGLTEWYPGRRFEKPEVKSKSKKRFHKPKPVKRTTPTKAAPETAQEGAAGIEKPVEQKPGESRPRVGTPKLTAEQAEQIRVLRSEGRSQAEIAKQFGVSRGAVWGITSGKSWKSAHVNGKAELKDGTNLQD